MLAPRAPKLHLGRWVLHPPPLRSRGPPRTGGPHRPAEADVHPVALHEDEPLQCRSRGRERTGERLDDPVEVVEQDRDDWSGDELGDPSTGSGFAVEQTLVEAFDECDILVTLIEERTGEADDEPHIDVRDVAVDQRKHAPARSRNAPPRRPSSARAGARSGSTSFDATTRAPAATACLSAVPRPVVHHDGLIHERNGIHEVAADRDHDAPDGRLFVPGRDDDADGAPRLCEHERFRSHAWWWYVRIGASDVSLTPPGPCQDRSARAGRSGVPAVMRAADSAADCGT